MKEELNRLKTDVKELVNTSNKFIKRRGIFNFEVKEALEETGIKEFYEFEKMDSYSKASMLYIIDKKLISIIEKLKAEHPKYGESRIKAIAKNLYISDNRDVNEAYIDQVIDLYFLYENLGYSKVRELELKKDELSSKLKIDTKEQVEYVKNNSGDIWEETKDKVSNTLTKTRRRVGKFLLDLDKDE